MNTKVYFTIQNERADKFTDFYKFSKEPIAEHNSGLPLCMGGCVCLERTDIDGCKRLFNQYMREAKKLIETTWRNKPMVYHDKKNPTPEHLIEQYYEKVLNF